MGKESTEHKIKIRLVIKKLESKKKKHGQSAGRINRKIISEEGASLWWSNGDLKGENESETKADQEHVLRT